MTNEIDWTKAPEGTEYSYQGNWWKVVNGIMFRWENKSLTGSFCSGHHWARSLYVEQITEKMKPRPKPLQPVFTKAMQDAGGLPSVGMEFMWSQWAQEELKLCKMLGKAGDECWIEAGDTSIIVGNITGCKPITPPIELIDGKAYQFNIVDCTECGIYRSMNNRFYNVDGDISVNNCTNIKLLEVK